MKRFKILCAVLALSVLSSITAYAGQWQQTGTQWKYQNDNGSYAVGWQWLDGNNDSIAECYYLNNDGIMLASCTTPDNYTVNADGQWVVDGVIQTKFIGEDTSSSHDKTTPTPQTQPTNSNPQVETPTTGGGQSMADLFPGWEGGEPTPDDVSDYPIGAGEVWH